MSGSYNGRSYSRSRAGFIDSGIDSGNMDDSDYEEGTEGGTKKPYDDEVLIPEIWFNDLSEHPRLILGKKDKEGEDGKGEESESAAAAAAAEASCYCVGFLTAGYANRLLEVTNRSTEKMAQILLEQLQDVMGCLSSEHMQAENNKRKEKKSNNKDKHKDKDKEEVEEEEEEVEHLPKPKDVFLGGTAYIWDSKSHPFIGGGYSSPIAPNFDHDSGEAMSVPLTRRDYVDDYGRGDYGSPDSDSADLDLDKKLGLYFAGEGTSSPGATAHSAIETGIVAARHVADC